MRKYLWRIISLTVLLLLIGTGFYKVICNIFVWLFTLQFRESSVSMVSEIIVKILTFVITYSVVGLIFNSIGWFNSGAMKIAYFVISTIISFVMCYLVMIFETHIILFAIIGCVLLVLIITCCVISAVVSHKRKNA